MTTYERYFETVEDDTPQYIVDCEGNLHDLSGNIQIKIDSVDKSRRYWETVKREQPDNTLADRFFNKFTNLYEQLILLIETNKIVDKKLMLKSG